MRSINRAILVAIVGVSCSLACNQEEERRQAKEQLMMELAQQQERERRDRIEKQKADIRANPNRYLEASNFTTYDEGFINHYRQLVGVSMLNKSPYSLTNIRGDVEWLTDNGDRLASMPFSLSGAIPSGDSKRFTTKEGTLTNGTAKCNAKRIRINVTSVELVEVR